MYQYGTRKNRQIKNLNSYLFIATKRQSLNYLRDEQRNRYTSLQPDHQNISIAYHNPENVLIYNELNHPANKISFLKTSGKLVQQKANVEVEMAWLNDKFVFEETSLNDIANTLVRNYNIAFDFENKALKNCRLTGTFET